MFKTKDLPEHLLIITVYIAIGPFFVDLAVGELTGKGKAKALESTSSGSIALKALRLNALALLRTVYAKYETQRQWIVEEILTSLASVPDIKHKSYKLRNGKAIHTVSALLLHLTQSAAHNIPLKIQRKFERISSGRFLDGETPGEAQVSLRCTLRGFCSI